MDRGRELHAFYNLNEPRGRESEQHLVFFCDVKQAALRDRLEVLEFIDSDR